MTNGQLTTQLDQDEVAAFATKLEAWGAQLPPREQALLQVMLSRAGMPGSADVEGLAGQGSPGQLAGALLRPLLGLGIFPGSDTFTAGRPGAGADSNTIGGRSDTFTINPSGFEHPMP